MYRPYLPALALTLTICLPGFISLSSAEEVLTEQRFRQLHKQLQPADDELWRTIPWRTSLLDAQRRAITEKKPIFIWAMDGHPLGCT
ncbi:MAG: hypothetical protein HN617_06685 [Planctomycetaceae bacterium]|jgi:hypothetical protein|nr:hypothetical protein [Planctomycetaceae bacterium]MBT4724541.1 hypothetical protein [Planctomycetaceae bacterium]MBT4846584.1 hypothetical protein [Planctomycetaceae bacterium]MBT5125121.1 hypothetical protein [Planctomycetaceae bacterium]MBT5597782.1 hypothetical protein [Planctomycetaceae bacterium]